MSFHLYNSVLMIFIVLLIWVPWLWRYKIKPAMAKYHVYHKVKQHPDWRRLVKTDQFLTELFHGVNGTATSKKERARLGIDDDAFIYGEVEFLPFFGVLERVSPSPGEVFYDLGSGAGKAVFFAASFFPFAKVYGVECLPALYDLANHLMNKAKGLLEKYASEMAPTTFVMGDFLTMSIADADIVFINATCMSVVSWEKLMNTLLGLKVGSRIVVTSKKINHPCFALLHEDFVVMSWGVNSINSYQKISPADAVATPSMANNPGC